MLLLLTLFFFSFFFSSYRTVGTLAARLQSQIGNVAAGSLFASVQATTVGAAIPGVAQVVGGTAAGGRGSGSGCRCLKYLSNWRTLFARLPILRRALTA